MKKFIFSLQVLEQYKLGLEKEQQIALAELVQKIKALEAKQRQTLADISRINTSLDAALQNGDDIINNLKSHNDYLDYLAEILDQLEQEIAKLEQAKAKVQEQLLAIMKELKTLDKLREKEYQAYLSELKLEEEKIIGDLVAHAAAAARN